MSADSVRSLGPEKSAPSVSLFLDFDGTLAPIQSDPSSVQLSSSQIAVLLDLSSFIPVFVMSGRAYTDIDRRIPVDRLSGLSGDHGAVRRFNDEILIHPAAEKAGEVLGRWLPDLLSATGNIPGIRVEVKEFSVSVHYRQLPDERVGQVYATLSSLFRNWTENGLFHLVGGKKVWEIRPKGGVTKEETLDFFLSRLEEACPGSGKEFLPVMIGDDTTDLLAVNRAIERGGKGYWVGERPDGLHEKAELLADPPAVWRFLGTILEEARSRNREGIRRRGFAPPFLFQP